MKNIHAIIFDFDGVILDSVSIKSDAFAEIYRPHGTEIEQKALAYHHQHGGISRYVKFKHLHQTLLGKTLSEAEIEHFAQKYADLVKNKVIKCPMIHGIHDFLEKYHQKIDFFVSSGTPQAELREITLARNLNRFFKVIYGSPDQKPAHIERIIEQYRYDRNHVIFVGDASTDRDAAQACQIPFIAREDGSKLLANEKFSVTDFTYFEQFLDKNFNSL